MATFPRRSNQYAHAEITAFPRRGVRYAHAEMSAFPRGGNRYLMRGNINIFHGIVSAILLYKQLIIN